MALAFVRGLQERGVAATLKHFPGLGTVFQDEDAVAQTVRLPLATLRRIDESPFLAGARAGVKLVMTSTAIYPALSPRPAMLSPRVSTAELRGQAGFQGVSITDDISVQALRRFGSLAANGRERAEPAQGPHTDVVGDRERPGSRPGREALRWTPAATAVLAGRGVGAG